MTDRDVNEDLTDPVPSVYTNGPTPPPTRSAQLTELTIALVKAQGAMSGAKKDATNPHFQSKYADLASVWDAIREPLSKNGLAVVQLPSVVQGGVEIETMLLHVSGQYITSVLWLPCQQTVHAIGSSITYGRRYGLMAVVGVAPEDDDGNAGATKTGSAAGGADFRPASRSQSSAAGRRMAADEPQLATDRPKGTVAGGKLKTVDRAEKTQIWVDNAIETLNLSAQGSESIRKYWSSNEEQIVWIEANFPDQYERVHTAYENALEAAITREA